MKVDIHQFLSKPLLGILQSNKDIAKETYLVGGVIRDLFFDRNNHDYDVVVKTNSIPFSRKIADTLGGDFYVLDKERQIARILFEENGSQALIDVAMMAGGSIKTDLLQRDFSMNAMAVDIHSPSVLIDPCNGVKDIEKKELHPCSKNAFQNDPVRTIRAVRFSQQFLLRISEESDDLLRNAVPGLIDISGERKRDEFVKIFESPNWKNSIMMLMDYGILGILFPDINMFYQVKLSPPHIYNAIDHTLMVVHFCEQLLWMIEDQLDKTENAQLRKVKPLMASFQQPLLEYFNNPLLKDRDIRTMLLFAGLFHDIGKARIQPVWKNERYHFPEHAKLSGEILSNTMQSMGFSNKEINFCKRVVQNHMKLSSLYEASTKTNPLKIHKFFKRTGPAGVLTILLHMADVLATYGETITPVRWDQAISFAGDVLDAYFHHNTEIIEPPVLITGTELIQSYNIAEGKEIGLFLEKISKAQVKGNVQSKADAHAFIQQELKRNGEKAE